MIKWWLHDNGIWNGPEEEMQKGAKEIKEQPDSNYSWDWNNNIWILDYAVWKNEVINDVLSELSRTNQYVTPDSPLQPAEQQQVIDYRKSLRAYMNNPMDNDRPECPYCATLARLQE